MKIIAVQLFAVLCLFSCAKDGEPSFGEPALDNGIIQYQPVQLTTNEKKIVSDWLNTVHSKYDPAEKMVKTTVNGYQYHTDALSGIYHEVRLSLWYAVNLLDLGNDNQRALEIIEKAISLQDNDPSSKSYGVWPYYLEEPLATKKSPVDYNMADFNAVTLLDIWMGHQDKLPTDLKLKVKDALIMAAKAIRKRNVDPGYTNIAIMGTYVTFMVGHLFNIEEQILYSGNRLRNFYNYTVDKNGFTEYNSPTYTIEAIDDLERMMRHIIEPGAKKMIETLYSMAWDMIARHYHKPTAQWVGPHSRCYSTLVNSSFYTILNQASGGQLTFEKYLVRTDVKIRHQIPTEYLSYFIDPVYPRNEIDIFEKTDPQIIGTSYLTDNYAFSTANRSCLWNQRRPFLVYWGNIQKPKYLQVRFLHDFYDFSCADIYTKQSENNALAFINFSTNGGDKHISIDRISNGKIKANDLRLRFEFGNCTLGDMVVPSSENAPFSLTIDQLTFNIHLFKSVFGNNKGYWEKGSDSQKAWIDFVIYSGASVDFDLTSLNEAILGFTLSLVDPGNSITQETPQFQMSDQIINAQWNNLELTTDIKPKTEPAHL